MFYVMLAKDKCRKQEPELHCDGLSSAYTIGGGLKKNSWLLCFNVHKKLQGI